MTAVRERERLARENERLLLNILPAPIAQRLRSGEPLIADRFDDVTLLFADVVEFTRLSATLSPTELVSVLNEVFSAFDELVDLYDLEKVKTIGDAYMVVGGLTDGSGDHTERVANMALALTAAVDRIDAAVRLGICFRIGIHCGSVVAGVIGTRKFIYDIWGDAVNLASRMESLGAPGRIQVTHAVKERLAGRFLLEPRGLIEVKGKGPTPAWFLLARAEAPGKMPRAVGGRLRVAGSRPRAPSSRVVDPFSVTLAPGCRAWRRARRRAAPRPCDGPAGRSAVPGWRPARAGDRGLGVNTGRPASVIIDGAPVGVAVVGPLELAVHAVRRASSERRNRS